MKEVLQFGKPCEPRHRTGTETEMNAITDALPGELFTVVNESTKVVVSINFYSGTVWCKY